MEKIAVRIIVIGKVQGVFYRKSAVEKAVSLSLYGWVKNNPDGSVEIEAEGCKTAIGQLINWCKTGPKNAIVDRVEEYEVPLANYSDFRIIR